MNAKESLLNSLNEERKRETEELIGLFNLTEQNQLELIKNEVDLMLFAEDSIGKKVDIDTILRKDKGQRRNAFIAAMRDVMNSLEKEEIDYSTFPTLKPERGKIEVLQEDITLGFGRCPFGRRRSVGQTVCKRAVRPGCRMRHRSGRLMFERTGERGRKNDSSHRF